MNDKEPMTNEQPNPEPNSCDGLIKRARDLAIALRESPSRSLSRLLNDETLALQQALADLQIQYSLARDILLDEECFLAATSLPEDEGMFELPSDHDYETRLMLHKVKHRTKGEVYVVGVPIGGAFAGELDAPPVKFLTHQSRVPTGNGWAKRYESGLLLADGIVVSVTCKGGKFSVEY